VTPLSALTPELARRLGGVVFDLDGTVLTDGRLSLSAYGALHELRASELRLVACTGRPALWGEVVARQWPVELCVAENGALAYRREGSAVIRHDRYDPAARKDRRARLASIVATLRARYPDLELSDDNDGRLSDVTFDVGERCRVAADRVAVVRAAAHDLGARTFVSSIHLHVTLEPDDKASGTVRVLVAALGEDPTRALSRYAFVGDSANDAACFAAFRLTLGVANVREHLASLHVPPRYTSDATQGDGFAEIAARLVELREAP
jgi:HAD superfamily hydrolase (TIGR01484 family)